MLRFKKKFVLKTLAGIAAFLFMLFVLIIWTPLNDWVGAPLKHADTPRKVDVIIVLGGGLEKSGQTGKSVQARLLEGAALFQQGYATHLIMTGGPAYGTAFVEARQMSVFERQHGIPVQDIFLEQRSTSTHENALYSKDILVAHGWRTAMIVTSDFHSARACKVFKKLDYDVTCIAADQARAPLVSSLDKVKRFKAIVRDYGATVYYTMRGYI